MLGSARLQRPDIHDLLVRRVSDSLKYKNKNPKHDQDNSNERQSFHFVLDHLRLAAGRHNTIQRMASLSSRN